MKFEIIDSLYSQFICFTSANKLPKLLLPLQGGWFYCDALTQGGAEYRLPWAKIPCPAGAAFRNLKIAALLTVTVSVITLRFIPAFAITILLACLRGGSESQSHDCFSDMV
jgi:hypothetical protein